jgi:hypothetical protein
LALNPAAETKSQELKAAFAANHAQALANAEAMIQRLREAASKVPIPPRESE